MSKQATNRNITQEVKTAMTTKKVVTPKAPKKVDPKEALSTLAGKILCGKSGMIAVKATFTAITIVDGGEIVEVPMGSIQTPPRENKSGSRGFYLNGKLSDPTVLGQAQGTRFQVGANITAVGSKTW